MPFLAEDGTGLSGANSYIEVAFADAYFEDRNVTTWATYSETVKKAALIAATDYIDSRFGPYFRGTALETDQALVLPTDEFDGIPTCLKKATAEYGLRAAVGPLAPDIEVDPTGYQVMRKFEVVGPIEERTDYAIIGPGSTRNLFTPYPAADLLLRPLVRTNGNSVIRN